MNIHQLQENEARYLLFAFKKVLRDRDIIPPAQVQFYESYERLLRKKLEWIDQGSDGRVDPPERDRYAKVRPTWYDVAVGNVPPDPSADS